LSEDDIGMSLLTWTPKGEDGYFLFLAAPPAEVQEKEVAAKDVVFVFDRTGSMSGDKIEQAREALKFSLRNLNAKDRFNVVTFNETPAPLFDKLQPATKANVDKALEMAGALTAVGGTNIDEALTTSSTMLNDKTRPSFVLFLTDGLPTVGVTDVDQILADVQKAMPKFARVFVFGVGYDVNTFLLDKMAGNHNGVPEYIRPGEDLEIKVSDLYRKISYPILSNLSIDWGAMKPYDMFPSKIPDLFKGSQVIVAGRFKGSGTAKLKLTGEASGKTESFTISQNLSESMPLNDFIPTLWAQRKINFLLAEIRLKGHNKELVDEVIRLSKQFGIITEYTSFLVEEPGMMFSEGFDDEADGRFREEAAPKMAMDTGGSAVNQSMNAQIGINSKTANVNAQGYYDGDGNMVTVNQVRQVQDRVFFQQGSNWIENTYTDKMDVIKIKAFSEAQFQLLEKDPALGKYMSVGSEVLIMVNGNAVQISAEGQEKLSDKDLKKLFGS
jgi:Ca-activated chloride channel family protein